MNTKQKSRELRRLAEDVLARLDIFVAEQADLATSLVRQWITYEGKATLFLDERQIYFLLTRTPLGRTTADIEEVQSTFIDNAVADWNINEDELPEIFQQLNRGQSAEFENMDGLLLRLWVDPKTQRKGIEPLVPEPKQEGRKRDYHKVALHELEKVLGGNIDEDEMFELVCSVAKQWQQHEGHACLFLDGKRQLLLTVVEQKDGFGISKNLKNIELDSLLKSLGISEDAIPEVIVQINLDHDVQIRDQNGTIKVLRHDPKERKLRLQSPHRTPTPASPATMSSIFCPVCTAVLGPWVNGQNQICPNCGHKSH